MTRKTTGELQEIMTEAQKAFPTGHFIRHKGSGGEYMIQGHALREGDLEPLVTYSPRFGAAIVFSRPLAEIAGRFDLSDGERWPEQRAARRKPRPMSNAASLARELRAMIPDGRALTSGERLHAQQIGNEAAVEIERLRAALERLRAAE